MVIREDARSASGGILSNPVYDHAILGFSNYWYPVRFSYEVKNKPVSVTVCGEKILLMRDRGKKIYALHDRCPHRGVPLSLGKQQFPGTISCAYHGWTYELCSGRLVALITDGPDSKMCGKANIRTYPVEERAGIIWVYMGDGTPPPVEEDVPGELLRPDVIIRGRTEVRKGNWRYAVENSIDEGHAKYLHRNTPLFIFQALPVYTREVRMVPTQDGLWLDRISAGELVTQDTFPGLGKWPPKKPFWKRKSKGAIGFQVRLPCITKVHHPLYTNYYIFVPCDEDHHIAVIFAATWGNQIRKLIFRAHYWSIIRPLNHGKLNGEDQVIIERMQIPPERLYRPDIAITKWREWCRDRVRGKPLYRNHPGESALALATMGGTSTNESASYVSTK